MLCMLQRRVYKDVRYMLIKHLIRAEEQGERFEEMLGFCRRHFIPPMMVHDCHWETNENVKLLMDIVAIKQARD